MSNRGGVLRRSPRDFCERVPITTRVPFGSDASINKGHSKVQIIYNDARMRNGPNRMSARCHHLRSAFALFFARL